MGNDYIGRFREGLGAGWEKLVVADATYEVTDPRWATPPYYIVFKSFVGKWNPTANQLEGSNVSSYIVVHALVQVLKQCGDALSRENIMRQAPNIKDLEVPLLLPGIKVNTSPTNFYPIRIRTTRAFRGRSLDAVRRFELGGGELSQGFLEERDRSFPRQLCRRLVIAGRRVVVEPVLGPCIGEFLMRDVVCR